jgi:hypothetical protein
MPTLVRALIVLLIGCPAFFGWPVAMFQSFTTIWLLAEQQTSPAYLHRAFTLKEIALPVAWMSACYLMFEFGALLLGERRLGKTPQHQALAASLQTASQILALLAFYGGVAAYHGVRREAPESASFVLILGAAVAALAYSLVLGRKWSRRYEKLTSGPG